MLRDIRIKQSYSNPTNFNLLYKAQNGIFLMKLALRKSVNLYLAPDINRILSNDIKSITIDNCYHSLNNSYSHKYSTYPIPTNDHRVTLCLKDGLELEFMIISQKNLLEIEALEYLIDF